MVESTKSFKCPVATPNLETCLANLSQWPFAKFLDTNPAGVWWPTSQKATASNTEYWIAYAMGETVLFFESKCLFLVFVTQGGGLVKWRYLYLSGFSRFVATGFSGISPWSGSGYPHLVLGWGDGRHWCAYYRHWGPSKCHLPALYKMPGCRRLSRSLPLQRHWL